MIWKKVGKWKPLSIMKWKPMNNYVRVLHKPESSGGDADLELTLLRNKLKQPYCKSND